MQFLDWFVKEQGEEEKNAEDLIKKMKLYGEDAKGLYMLNSEMAARVYTCLLYTSSMGSHQSAMRLVFLTTTS